MAKLLGINSYGAYTYYSSISTLVFLPFSGTLIQWVTREVAKKSGHSVISKYLIVYSLVITVTSLTITYLSEAFSEVFVLFILLAACQGAVNLAIGELRGAGRVNWSIFVEVMSRSIILTFLLLTFYAFNVDVSIDFLLITFISIYAIFTSVILFGRKKPECDVISDKVQIKKYLLTFIATSAPAITTELILISFGLGGNNGLVAVFRVGFTLLSVTGFITTIINANEGYKFAKMDCYKERTKAYKKLIKVSIAITVPLFFTLIYCLSPIVRIGWGAEYVVYSTEYRVLLLGSLVNAVSGPIGMILLMSKREKDLLKSGVTSLLPVIVLYIFDLSTSALSVAVIYLVSVIILNVTMVVFANRNEVIKLGAYDVF